MRKELFDEQVGSVRDAGAIMRGEMEPSRFFVVEKPDVRSINMTTKADQVRTEAVSPHIGIFYLVDGKIFLDAVEAHTIRSPGKLVSFNRSHVLYWETIVASERPDLKGTHFAYFPRGRVTYFKDKEKYVIWLDECIAVHEIEEIRSRMNLTPENSEIVVGGVTSQHYKCHLCHPKDYKNVMGQR